MIDQIDGHRYHGDNTSNYPGIYQSWQAEFTSTESNGFVEVYYNKYYGGSYYTIDILDSNDTVIDSTTYDLNNGSAYSSQPSTSYVYSGDLAISFSPFT